MTEASNRKPEGETPERVVVLRGIAVEVPDAYRKLLDRSSRPALFVVMDGLRRFLTYSVAVAFHLLLAFFFLLLVVDPSRGDPNAPLEVGLAGLHRPVPKPEEIPVENAPEPTPEPVPPEPLPEVKPEEPVPLPPVPAAESVPDPAPEPSPDPVPAPAAETAKPSTIGGGPSTTGGRPASGNGPDIEADPLAALKSRRAGVLEQLRGGREMDIVVVEGGFDHVERVLDRLGIPHRVIPFRRLAETDLSETGVLLINCDGGISRGNPERETESLEANRERALEEIEKLEKSLASARKAGLRTKIRDLERRIALQKTLVEHYEKTLQRVAAKKEGVRRVVAFVEKGGSLFTSDWGLTLLEEIFPGYVSNGGLVGPRTVSIRPKAKNHDLLEEVFTKSTTTRKMLWEIDASSYLIRVKHGRVEVLVESPQLPKHPAVAVTFPYERGRVLHILSHFHRQVDARGEYALQNMLLNFLVERLVKER